MSRQAIGNHGIYCVKKYVQLFQGERFQRPVLRNNMAWGFLAWIQRLCLKIVKSLLVHHRSPAAPLNLPHWYISQRAAGGRQPQRDDLHVVPLSPKALTDLGMFNICFRPHSMIFPLIRNALKQLSLQGSDFVKEQNNKTGFTSVKNIPVAILSRTITCSMWAWCTWLCHYSFQMFSS